MKNMTIEKLKRVDVNDPEINAEGIVAFQLVNCHINFYGAQRTDRLDTKIMKDGRQIVIDGNGFISSGTEI